MRNNETRGTGDDGLLKRMRRAVTLICIAIVLSVVCAAETTKDPRVFLKQHVGLTAQQILAIGQGKIVTKAMPSRTPAELFVVGATFVKAPPEAYAKLAFDMERLRRSPSYMAVGRLSDPPRFSDLDGFTFEPEDIRSLRSCRPGRCGVQLPEETILTLNQRINWEAPDATLQANHQVKKMVLDLVHRYQAEGNRAIGSYRDKDHPFDVDAQFRALLAQSPLLPAYLPSLREYLLEYPRATLPNVESFFFWEKVSFGLKPTLRLNHAISYRTKGPLTTGEIVVVKQLYASHYLQLALDLTACVPGNSGAGEPGFYLITFKGSTQQGLTGFFGSILRTIIVSKTRTAQEKILLNIKTSLERDR
ncbi:MAG: hypothetical protein KIT83_07375 [Bryobacterales bacterium]|nr:hypothetical protein [Bryobacterales bacterium]